MRTPLGIYDSMYHACSWDTHSKAIEHGTRLAILHGRIEVNHRHCSLNKGAMLKSIIESWQSISLLVLGKMKGGENTEQNAKRKCLVRGRTNISNLMSHIFALR